MDMYMNPPAIRDDAPTADGVVGHRTIATHGALQIIAGVTMLM
jgi:hypothetical protein